MRPTVYFVGLVHDALLLGIDVVRIWHNVNTPVKRPSGCARLEFQGVTRVEKGECWRIHVLHTHKERGSRETT